MGLWDGIGEFLREVTLPEEVARGIREGDASFHRRRFRQALEAYDRGLDHSGDYAPLHVKRGMALFFLEDHLGALRAFERALRLRRNDRDALFWQGKTLIALGRPGEAIAPLRRSRALGLDSPQLPRALGMALLATGRPDRARIELERALRQAPEDGEILEGLARAHEAMGRHDRVVALVKRHEISKGPRALTLLLARALRRLGRSGEALAPLQALVARDGRDGEAFALLGACHLDLNEADLAEGCFRQACTMEGAGANAFSGLGGILLLKGQREGARSCFLEGLAAHGSDPALGLGAAWCALEAGDWEETLDRAGMVAVSSEGGVVAAAAMALRAWASLQLGKASDAETYLHRGEALAAGGGESVLLRWARAWFSMRRGDFESALQDLKTAVVEASDCPAIGPISSVLLRQRVSLLLDEAFEAHRSQTLSTNRELAVAPDKVEGTFATVSPSIMSFMNRLQVMVDHREGFEDAQRQLARIRSDYDKPLLVTIMGEFNTGKSTFINALIGQKVAPVGIVPTTATINVLKWGAEKKIRICYEDGTVQEAPIDQLEAFVDERRGDKAILRSVSTVEILYPLDILQTVNVVDTPGLNAPIPEHERITRDFVASADAVLWLFNAGQAGKATEKEALDFVRAHSKKVVALVNKIDRVSPDELTGIIEDLERDFDGAFVAVGAVSAKQALKAALEKDDEKWKESRFGAFLEVLSHEVFGRVRQLKDESSTLRLLEWLDGLEERRKKEQEGRNDWLAEGRRVERGLEELGNRFENDVVPLLASQLRKGLEGIVKDMAREGADGARKERALLGERLRYEREDRLWMEESFLAGYRSFAEEQLGESIRSALEEELERIVEEGRRWLERRSTVLPKAFWRDLSSRQLQSLDDFVLEEHLAYYRGLVAGGALQAVFEREEREESRADAGRLAGRLLRTLRLDGEGLRLALRRWYASLSERIMEILATGQIDEGRSWIERERNLYAPAQLLGRELHDMKGQQSERSGNPART